MRSKLQRLRVLSVLCGEESADIVGFAIVAAIGVRHGVILRIGRKHHWWDFLGSRVAWAFELGVISVGCGRVEPFHNFLPGWIRGQGF